MLPDKVHNALHTFNMNLTGKDPDTVNSSYPRVSFPRIWDNARKRKTLTNLEQREILVTTRKRKENNNILVNRGIPPTNAKPISPGLNTLTASE